MIFLQRIIWCRLLVCEVFCCVFVLICTKLLTTWFSGLLHCIVWWLNTSILEDHFLKMEAAHPFEMLVSNHHTT